MLSRGGLSNELATTWRSLRRTAYARRKPDATLVFVCKSTYPSSNCLKTMSAVTSSPSSQDRSTPSACVHSLFELRVSETPQAIAIQTDSTTWSYEKLDSVSNRIANNLLRFGVDRGSLVGLAIQRSPEAIAGMLGILKAGAAYVPLDTSYPLERLRFMLKDAALSFLVTDEDSCRNLMPLIDSSCILIDVQQLQNENAYSPDISVDPDSLAYVMYTSGSTGEPKGVMIEHGGIIRLVSDPSYISISADDIFLQLASLSFDAATFEIWAPLLNGATLVLMPADEPALSEIADVLDRHRISTLWLTSGLFNAMVDEFPNSLRHLKYLLAGGDVLSPPHVRNALNAMPQGCVINGYGPTESTTFACCHRVRPEDTAAASIPIGLPIAGTEVYILNVGSKPVSGQESGEIYIGGDGLARGYLNRPQLTKEKFVKHPFSIDPTARLYRTGDMGRFNRQGEIEFLGRIDSQVKIRGFRVETSEIELAAGSYPGIAVAAVVVKGATADDKSLSCFFVPRSGTSVSGVELDSYLRQKLPSYMIPAQFVSIPSLPLNGNGKVDRKRLAAGQFDAAPVAPDVNLDPNSLEARLIAMLTALLRVPSVGLDDDFFKLGGHSLLAARLFAQIETRFGKKLPLVTMIHARTVRSLAAVIRDDHWVAPWSSLVPLQATGSRPPFFLVHAIGGNVLNYGKLAEGMPADQPVYALQAQGLDGESRAAASVEEMAAHYIRAMDTIQPNGPYYLGGFSAGGVVALEMAVQLHRAGRSVALLALLDSSIIPSFSSLIRKRNLAVATQKLHGIVRFNLHYMARIGVGDFLGKKRRNFLMNARILAFEVRNGVRKLAPLPHSGSLPVEESFVRAISRYDPAPYFGDALLFRTADTDLYPDGTLGWGRVIQGNLEIKTLRGDHDNLLDNPQLELLIQELTAAIINASLRVAER